MFLMIIFMYCDINIIKNNNDFLRCLILNHAQTYKLCVGVSLETCS